MAPLLSDAEQPSLTFDHVGYAVRNIDDYLRNFMVPLFAPLAVTQPVDDPLQGVKVCFATVAGNVRIELVQPLSDASPVSRLLARRHGGLYHLCYATPDLEATVEAFKARGCRIVSGPTPAVAFGGRRIVFAFTPQSDLIELVELHLRKEDKRDPGSSAA